MSMRPSWRLFLLSALLVLGCSSGGGDGGSGPTSGALDGVAPSTTSPRSLERVEITGLPPARRTGTDYVVEFVGRDGIPSIPIEFENGTYFFVAPFHPDTPTTGGEIALRVASGNVTSPEFTLDLGALDDAPGAFAALATALAAHVDGFAARRGSSLEALKAISFEETPALLLPLRYAVSWIDDPANPHSFAAIASGESDLLDADQRRLLDQICGETGFGALIGTETGALDDLEPPLLTFDDALARRACIDARPTITSANQLSSAMWEAKFAEIAISGDAGTTLGALSATLAAGSTIPGYGRVFTVAGGATAAWQASRGALAGLNPSSFVAITADVTKTRFNEDSEEAGSWSNVQVTARSKGWSADQGLVDAVTTALGLYASTLQAAQFTASTFLSDAAVSFVNQGVSSYVGGREGGTIEFCPQEWTIDITSSLYSEGRSVVGAFLVATGARTFTPLRVDEDFLSIATRPEKFGQESIDLDTQIGVDAIVVIASPTEIVVGTPGEVVEITASLQNADDQKLYWDPGNGMWDDGLLQFTNEAGTRPLKTPTSPGDYPFAVTIESFSRKGLRASGTPTRGTTVTIRFEDPIVVTPANACVANGETETFEALANDEPADVVWTLEDVAGDPSSLGSISQAGVYTAPPVGAGQVVVVATSVNDEENRGTALVDVGSCSCFWSLTIVGDGNWGGNYASHGFPSNFGFFSMSWETDTGDLVGNLMAFTDPVTEGETGIFTPDTFSFGGDSQVWSATSDPQDGTSVTLEITFNDGDVLEGSLYGTAVTFIDGEGVLRSFDMNFRGGNLGSGNFICGEQ